MGSPYCGSQIVYLKCSTFMPHPPATCNVLWCSFLWRITVQPTVWGGQWYSECCDWVFPSARVRVELWLANLAEDVSHLLLLVSTFLQQTTLLPRMYSLTTTPTVRHRHRYDRGEMVMTHGQAKQATRASYNSLELRKNSDQLCFG